MRTAEPADATRQPRANRQTGRPPPPYACACVCGVANATNANATSLSPTPPLASPAPDRALAVCCCCGKCVLIPPTNLTRLCLFALRSPHHRHMLHAVRVEDYDGGKPVGSYRYPKEIRGCREKELAELDSLQSIARRVLRLEEALISGPLLRHT